MPPLSRPSSPQISLSKGDEYWWNAVLEGEEQIDIDKINKERSMATVDEEEHAVLDRLTFDYHQKLQGKPQSHELVGAGHQPGPSRGPSAGDGGIPVLSPFRGRGVLSVTPFCPRAPDGPSWPLGHTGEPPGPPLEPTATANLEQDHARRGPAPPGTLFPLPPHSLPAARAPGTSG